VFRNRGWRPRPGPGIAIAIAIGIGIAIAMAQRRSSQRLTKKPGIAYSSKFDTDRPD
jgi:hypothetical protein